VATQLLAAAVVGALSPAAALSTIMLLGSRRPVANTLACLAGWTVVLLALAGLLLALLHGHAGATGKSAKAMVELVVGLVLLGAGLRALVGGHQHPLQSPDTPQWMQRLEHVGPGAALVIGMVLIAVSPADLVAYFSAVQALVGDDDLSSTTRIVLWVVLVVCIDSCILIPLGVYVAMPRRADHLLDVGKRWLVAHQRAVAGGSAGVFGAVLLIEGAVALS
jgi:hypothetical protein